MHDHIDMLRESDLEILKELVRIPSIANRGDDTGVINCSKRLKLLFESLGLESRIFETPSQPVVYAELKSSNPTAKTILFYGHYDVQPVEPLDEWTSSPFDPVIREERIYGRGTADNKGQFLGHINAVRSFLSTLNDVPVNIKFVLDGEEETGSQSMEWFVRNNEELLKTDLVYFADGPSEHNGATTVVLGFRGMFSFEITLRTAKHANHSGRAGGQIPNAAIELSRLVASMINDKNQITIDGIYDDVLPPSPHEVDLINKMPFNPSSIALVYGVNEILLNKEQFYTQQMFLPTLTVNGVISGYIGPGRKTAVPEVASVKIDMRLAMNMDPNDVEEKVRKHIAKFCPKAELRVFAKQLPSKTPANLPICKAILETVKSHFPGTYIIPSSGATCPDFVWTKILKSPSVSVPYGNFDQSNHAANENLKLENFFRGAHCSADIIKTVSEL